MEKEPQPESMATVTIKPEYPPSEYSSEPPPAYHKPKSTAVQITKIVAVTIVLTSVILGSFLLASAYVSANANWRQLEQELELLSETSDRLHAPPQPEALIQEEPLQPKSEALIADAPKKDDTKEIETNNIDNDSDNSESSDSNSSSESEEDEKSHVPIRLPMDLEELAGALLEKNQKTKMNCIVEKKKAEEVVDHQSKTITLPFGVNLTTDPRYEKLSGERMVIVCESGTFQRSQPPQPPSPPPQDEEDQEDDTILIQPVMIPIPHTNFQTHMPQQMLPMQNGVPMRPPMRFPMRPPMPPMEAMRQPMEAMRQPMEAMRPPMPPMMHIQIQTQTQPQPQQQTPEFPPNSVLHHIIQQIIAQKIMEVQKAREEQARQQQLQQEQPQPTPIQMQEVEENRVPHRFQVPHAMIGQRIPIPEEILTQLNRLPNRDVIVAVSESDSDSEENTSEMRNSQEMRPEIRTMPRPLPLAIRPIPQEMRSMPQEMRPVQQEVRQMPQEVRQIPQMHLIPQEIRILPHPGRMIPQQEMREHQDVQEVRVPEMQMLPQLQHREIPEMRFVQEQRQNAAEVNGRQTFEQNIPVGIPIAVVQQQQGEQDPQEPQAAASEESRPHFVQPRSVQSVESLDS